MARIRCSKAISTFYLFPWLITTKSPIESSAVKKKKAVEKMGFAFFFVRLSFSSSSVQPLRKIFFWKTLKEVSFGEKKIEWTISNYIGWYSTGMAVPSRRQVDTSATSFKASTISTCRCASLIRRWRALPCISHTRIITESCLCIEAHGRALLIISWVKILPHSKILCWMNIHFININLSVVRRHKNVTPFIWKLCLRRI